MGELILLGAAVCLCQVAKAVFYALAMWKAHDFAYSTLLEIRLKMIEHIKKLPLSFFQKRKAGNLASIIDHDVERIELYLAHTLPEVVITNTICIAIFVIVTLLDWRLGIALISTVPFVFLLMPAFSKLWSKSVGSYQRSIKTVSENVMEYVSSIATIKAFSNDEKKTDKVLGSMYDYIASAKHAIVVQAVPMSVITTLMEGGIVAVAIVGSIILSNEPITAWAVVVYILAIVLAGQFSKNFSKSMSLAYNKIVYKNTEAAVDSVMEAPVETEKAETAFSVAGDIEFRNVSFGYDERELALKDVDVIFQKNLVSAIVGPSGAGKSTIATLILGLWRPDAGVITIGGRKVEDFSDHELSSLISIVQQDTFLFNSSIEENICIGKQNASHEDVVWAAKEARIHDVIATLPDGYQTVVGEAGVKLSGGEKQRISLARMILKDAPIVILDEATSALDPNNEMLIQQAIGRLCENKTLIVIAHHLSTIESADQIVVMEDGRITARGTHAELLEKSEMYNMMVAAERQAENWDIKGDGATC